MCSLYLYFLGLSLRNTSKTLTIFKNKLLVIPSGLKTIRILPPLIITENEISKGVIIFEKILKEFKH